MLELPHWAEWFSVDRAPDGETVRHRVLFGGRGGAKSTTIAYMLVVRARQGREQILCLREFQNSIRDSSKKLIEQCIDDLGWGAKGDRFFTSTANEIRGRNGSRFSFLGLAGREASIKSLEGYTIASIEEAATISQVSIDALIPTIRREGSEIWWAYNPRFSTDPVDQMFRGSFGPPPGTVLLEIHWRDNPWFPKVLQRDMEYDRQRDPAKYRHIWEGAYLERDDARVFHNWSIRPFDAPADAVFRFGCDWGYARDPTVLVRCFLGRWDGEPGASAVVADAKGDCLFVDHEAYAIRCEIDDMPALFAGYDKGREKTRWANVHRYSGVPEALKWPIIADSSRPDLISKLQHLGFRIEPAKKGKDSIEEGIEFLQNYQIYVHPRCRHTADELASYRWKVDRQTGIILPQLQDANNHVIDALRYALEGVRTMQSSSFEFMSAGPSVILEMTDRFGAPGGLAY
jgi:phage terminase large subunit